MPFLGLKKRDAIKTVVLDDFEKVVSYTYIHESYFP